MQIPSLNCIQQIQHQFNQDEKALRLIALLSPSRQTSINTILQLQSLFQQQQHDVQLQFYIIWQPVFPADKSVQSSPPSLPNTNLAEIWDEEKIVGQCFAQHVVGFTGLIWDMFFLYKPEAYWKNLPPQPSLFAGNIAQHQPILEQVLRLWFHRSNVSLPSSLSVYN